MVARRRSSADGRGPEARCSRDIKPNPVEANVDDGPRGLCATAAMTASSPSAAAGARRRQGDRLHGRPDAADLGFRGSSTTGGPAPIPTASRPSSPCRPPPAPARRSAAPASSRDEATHTKKIIFHPQMMPEIVIRDPELTVGLPPQVTAATGMDALAHCLEAYCAPFYHPMADGIAVEGMRLIKEWLPRAVQGRRATSRRAAHMLSAAAMGATAFQKGLGAMHACPIRSARSRHASRPDQCGVHALCAGL